MASAEHINEFKNLTLRDIRLYRDKIQGFLDTTYGTAENAVENLFRNTNDPDVLKNLDEMNTLLKVCREKLVVVANSIVNNTTESCQLSNQGLAVNHFTANICVPKMSVVFNKPYLVKILSPGSPSRFWLNTESTSTETIEKELKMTYINCTQSITLPRPGNYVVCLHSDKYCRGKVITTMEFNTVTASKVDVMLIDYGEIITTTANKLYPMQTNFCKEPAHGLLCCVHNLEPVNQIWDLEAIVFFNQLCENITATFHDPPKERVNTDAFSIYFPDFYVSLQTRDCKENADIRLAMIRKGMGTSSDPLKSSQTLLNEFVNSPPPELSPTKSSNEADLKPITSNKSSWKTYGAVDEYGTSGSSCKLSASNDLVVDSSKISVTDPSSSKNSSLEPQNNGVLPVSQKPLFPNTNAKEFIYIKNSTSTPSVASQQYNNRQSKHFQDENLTDVNRTSRSGSGIVGKSSGSTDQVAKIRAVPLNGCSTFPVTSNLTDDIDDLFFVPDANKVVPIQPYDSDQQSLDPIAFDEPFREPSDPQLLNKFLNCVNLTIPINRQIAQSSVENSEGDTQSFVTASSQIQLSDHQVSSHGNFCQDWESQKTLISLDYKFGSVLKTRSLPMLGKSKTIRCCFSHVISPTHFYVQLLNEISTLVKPLNERLNRLYEHSQEVPVTQPEVGSFWVVQEPQTQIWSRAKILSVDINDEIGWKIPGKTKTPTCTVFLVDWGNVDVVPISQLRPLVKEILNIPCLAFRCRLAGIYPFERSVNFDEWSSHATDKFVELAGIDKELTALVSSSKGKDGAISLVLLKNGNEETYSVNEQLVFLRCASSDIFQQAPEESEKADDETEWGDPMCDDYFSPMNTPALNTENYDSVTTGYIPKDEDRICRFYAAKGSCFKGVKCDQLHSHPRKHVFTEDKIEVYVDVPSLPSLVSGSLIHIQVTCVTNAFRFYAILPHGTKNLENVFAADDESETLESMQQALQEEYTSNYFSRRITIAPSAGDVVIAKSPEDNKWYRGRVMEERENDFFAIYFLDYGNAQLVHLRNLCNPVPRFIHLPAQAVEMYLNGIDTSATADTIQAKNVLVSLVKNRDLVARVVHTIPFVCVDLYNTSGPSEIDVAIEMVRLKATTPVRRKPFCFQKWGQEFAG